jgi:hypothetical protein
LEVDELRVAVGDHLAKEGEDSGPKESSHHVDEGDDLPY